MSQPVINKDAVMQRILSNSNNIKAFGVKKIGLFGSFAMNTTITSDSDVDLLIELIMQKVNTELMQPGFM